MLTYKDVLENPAIRIYIDRADRALGALGYTEHNLAHVAKTASTVEYILKTLGKTEREIELAKIAAHLHDIGNLVNREHHSTNGAVMAFSLLNGLGMAPDEIATITGAIGNHDEGSGNSIDDITAALILADKSDVRRGRVREKDPLLFDIHDRVNYSVERAALSISEDRRRCRLDLRIDTNHGTVMDYFEIFMERMLFCRKAARKLGLEFELCINEFSLM